MPIGRWVIENALSFISNVKDLTAKRIHISVNVSVLQLMQEDFEEMILELLSIYRVSPDQFIIEITESVLMQAIEASVAKLERLQSTGVKVALDDFGTGYSSLSYLKNLPIDILKIDKSFIDVLGVSKSHDDLVEIIIRLGQQLDMHLVAEGVETEAQLEKLKAINCDAIQGYLFSKPVDAIVAKELLKKNL
jgi:EAL domain-containing protein (putative c-di-GMP-specific phosphodiesterase class I)